MAQIKRFFLFVVVASVVCGCRSNPTFDTLTTLLPWGKQYAQIQPGFEYLFVALDGRSSVMALGDRTVEMHPSAGRIHERWYTGRGEMLYLVDGRIHQALGFTHEVRGSAEDGAPAWIDVMQVNAEISWLRHVDLMPGFRYNVDNFVTTYKINAPQKLPKDISHEAKWVADLVLSKSIDGKPWWYLQKFALVNSKVVYSEQCIDKDLCLQMRPLGILIPVK